MQKKKILVTGKKGNISVRIAEWLTERGHVVENISLRGEAWLQESFQGYSAVVHVAGIVPKVGGAADDFYKINTELTKSLGEKAKKEGVRHFVYISSMAVYGRSQHISPKKGMITAQTACEPNSDYGKSKWQAEESLRALEDENFLVTCIRVPSVYGEGKTEYLDQYKHLNEKFGKIPYAFTRNYKSLIYLGNLCELIHLVLTSKTGGVICPDDGKYSAADICGAISPNVKKSRMLGFLFKTLLRKSDRVVDYYGAIYYEETFSNVFSGEYRLTSFQEAVKKAYEE